MVSRRAESALRNFQFSSAGTDGETIMNEVSLLESLGQVSASETGQVFRDFLRGHGPFPTCSIRRPTSKRLRITFQIAAAAITIIHLLDKCPWLAPAADKLVVCRLVSTHLNSPALGRVEGEERAFGEGRIAGGVT